LVEIVKPVLSGQCEITKLFVEAAGAHIAVHRSGRGPAIVCLHATGHSARDFQDIMRRFGATYEILAIDWPGHGDSPNDTRPASANRYADILADLLRILDLGKVVLIGNSIGGAAAIKVAAKQSEMVRALVLCDPGGLQRVSFVSRLYCRSMARFFATGEKGDPSFSRKFRRYYERSVLTECAASARREEIIASGGRVAPVLRQAWQSFAEQSADIRALTPRLRSPVLYAWARKDKLVAFSRSKRAVAATPQHQLVMFEASHSAFLEQPDQFEMALVAFLGKFPAAGGYGQDGIRDQPTIETHDQSAGANLRSRDREG
jgi:pimeloyl-ACP methyl ester carboxylesterase